jgi:hypothetical protein
MRTPVVALTVFVAETSGPQLAYRRRLVEMPRLVSTGARPDCRRAPTLTPVRVVLGSGPMCSMWTSVTRLRDTVPRIGATPPAPGWAAMPFDLRLGTSGRWNPLRRESSPQLRAGTDLRKPRSVSSDDRLLPRMESVSRQGPGSPRRAARRTGLAQELGLSRPPPGMPRSADMTTTG